MASSPRMCRDSEPPHDPCIVLLSAPAWDETVYAFLVEKRARSGSARTVESYARMLWPFLAGKAPDAVRSAEEVDRTWPDVALAVGVQPRRRRQPASGATPARPPSKRPRRDR